MAGQDQHIERLIQELLRVYQQTGERLKNKVLSADATSFQKFRAGELLKQVETEIYALNAVAYEFSRKSIPKAYARGMDITGDQLAEMGIKHSLNMGNVIHRSSVQVIADQMALDLIQANGTMETGLQQYVRRTKQSIIEESLINQKIGEGLVEGATRRQVSSQIEAELRKKLVDGALVKAGNRNFKPETYAELVARTRTREATTQATINSGVENGIDLFRVSVHEGACPVCQQYQGKVYSASGSNPDFPRLVERPPYHPNCAHVLLAVTEGHLRRRGEYDKLSELSRDENAIIAGEEEYRAAIGKAKGAVRAPQTKIAGDFPISQIEADVSAVLKGERERIPRDGPPLNAARVAAANAATLSPMREFSHFGNPIRVPSEFSYGFVASSEWKPKNLDVVAEKSPASAEQLANAVVRKYENDPQFRAAYEAWVMGRTAAMQEDINRSKVYVRIPEAAVAKVIQDGRFKSQFEAGTSLGLFDLVRREEAEDALFGNGGADARLRPIYGYLAQGGAQGGKTVEQYGRIVVELKEGVKERTTVTLGDSLILEGQGRAASGYFELQPGSFNRDPGALTQQGVNTVQPYAEAQIHGGVTLDDIARVIVYESGGEKLYDESVVTKLRAKGIPVEVLILP